MRRAGISLAAVVALGIAGAGCTCGKKKRQTRTSDAPPVELVSAAALADAGVGKPSETEEREPNDSAEAATALPPGAGARGRIDPEADMDYYRIEVAQAGGLSVQLPAVAGADLSLEIEDAAGASLAKSDRGAANVAEGVPNLGVTPGRYTAIVRKKTVPPKKPVRPKKGAPPAPEPPAAATEYVIRAQVAPFEKNAEREPDDDRGTANDLIVGDTVTGYLGWTGDADVWKLSIEAITAKHILDVELGPVENVALAVEIADGAGQLIASRKAPKGVALVIRNLAPAAQSGPPFHYVTVKGDRSNPEDSYQLKLTANPPRGGDPEVEPNDAPDKAMPIPDERAVIREASWSPGDVDCYAIPPDPTARTLEVSVEVPRDADLRLELFANGKSIATADQKGKGVSEKISGPVPAGGRAVVCVRGTDTSLEATYNLRVDEGQSKGP